MFYSEALVPYVSVGKPITKVTYKQTPRKHPENTFVYSS